MSMSWNCLKNLLIPNHSYRSDPVSLSRTPELYNITVVFFIFPLVIYRNGYGEFTCQGVIKAADWWTWGNDLGGRPGQWNHDRTPEGHVNCHLATMTA